MERRAHKDTTARTRTAAIAKASEIVERLARSAPTELGRATGADLVAHYLDPGRRPPRVKSWSIRHRDEQTRYCNVYVVPVIADLPCRELTRDDLQLILDKSPTKSVAAHIKSWPSGQALWRRSPLDRRGTTAPRRAARQGSRGALGA